MSQGVARLLARAAGGSLAVKVAGIALAFGTQLLLVRFLGVAEYGTYVYVLSWLHLLVLAGKLGWDHAAVRYVAEYRAAERWDLLRGFLRAALGVPLAAAAAVSLALALVVLLLGGSLRGSLQATFFVGALVLPINVLLTVVLSGLQGLRRVVAAQLPQQVLRPAVVAGLAWILFVWTGRALPASVALAINGLAGALALALTWVVFRRSLPAAALEGPPAYRTRDWHATALPLVIVTGLALLMNRIDVLVIGAVLGTPAAGVYSIAGRVAELIGFGMLAVEAILAPLAAELAAGGRSRELQRSASLGAAGILAFTVPAVAGAIAFGRPVLALFGPEFAAAYPALVVLALGQALQALAGASGTIATMTGLQRVAASSLAACVALDAALNVLLVPRFGLAGAAWSTAITMTAWRVLLVVAVKRKLGVDPTVWGLARARAV